MIYKTLSEARLNDGAFYFGKPCSKHPESNRRVRDRKCILCHRESVYKSRTKESHAESSLRSYHQTSEKNKLQRKVRRKLYYLDNKEAVLKKILEWQRSNPRKMNAIRARRRASLIDATPEWASVGEIWMEIVAFYDSCPEGFEVDHVVPLKGKTVCGLHVPWNFQYLTKSENSSKGNRLQN